MNTQSSIIHKFNTLKEFTNWLEESGASHSYNPVLGIATGCNLSTNDTIMKMTPKMAKKMPLKVMENMMNKKEEKGESKSMQKKELKKGEYKK